MSLGWKQGTVSQRARRVSQSDELKWLMVHGEVHCPEGAWSFRDEAFTEDEAVQLVEFLSVRPWTSERQLAFIEPCLAFSTRGKHEGKNGLLNLDIRFRGEVSPPFIRGDEEAVWGSGFTLGLFVKEDELRRFADGLGRMLSG
ncbi:MAG: hypothetical protein QM783_02150 [Phycisphaerales bacterium]